MVKYILALAATVIHSSTAFIPPAPHTLSPSFRMSSNNQEPNIQDAQTTRPLDPRTASDFTIQVCTSTNCSKRLQQLGLDQYHVLGEIYARAEARGVEECMIIEDGACQGGKNCRLGPCVAILHDDFDGNVALEGMSGNEFKERVFHNVITSDDVDRVWGCVENAVHMMADETSK